MRAPRRVANCTTNVIELFDKILTFVLRLADRALENMTHKLEFDYDTIIIGSGFGGSVAALRLAEKGYHVMCN